MRMKRILNIFLAAFMTITAVCAIFFATSPLKRRAAATENSAVIDEAFARPPKDKKRKKPEIPEGVKNVIDAKPFILDGKPCLAILSGEGDNFKQNVKIYLCRGKKILYEINAADGYLPVIEFYPFEQGERFLFFGSQTGGSGGYGNYFVYKLNNNGYDVLYSAEKDNAVFGASFVSGGFLKITNEAANKSVNINVAYVGKELYSQLFDDKNEWTGQTPYVNAVSAVFPYYNASVGTYGLISYRSVVAIAEVNVLGYITQRLIFDGKAFIPVSTDFEISLQ